MKAKFELALLSALLCQGISCGIAKANPFEVPVARATLWAQTARNAPGSVQAYFFAVPIRIGWTRLPALLDTGSIGLRVLPHQISARDIISSDKHPEQETFGGSVLLEGVAGKAPVALGLPLGSPVTLQLIQTGGCTPGTSTLQCMLAANDLPAFRFGGEGYPREGFPAIFGIRAEQPDAVSEVFNPLNQSGHNRYIIDLPRTNRDPGRLLVDPNQFQAEGFVPLSHNSAAQTATVRGCLVPPNGGQEICGPMLFDSGAPGISVTPHGVSACLPANAKTSPCFPRGGRATVRFTDAAGATLASETFTVGSEPYTQINLDKAVDGVGDAYISLGQLPFMAFTILIDTQNRTPAPPLAIRTRQNPPPNGPTGIIGG